MRDMRIEVHGAPIKRKDVPTDQPPFQKVAATFQSEQVPKQTHMSQAVSQQHFAEGLETASMECKRTKSTKVDWPGGLHHAKNFEASGFCYVTTNLRTGATDHPMRNRLLHWNFKMEVREWRRNRAAGAVECPFHDCHGVR